MPSRKALRRNDPVIATMEELLAQVDALPPPQITWTHWPPADRSAAREAAAQWTVGMGPWLVNDGAYGVLRAGRSIEFALRWEALSLEPAESARPHALALGDGIYQVEATVVRVDGDICVIDFGLLVYAHDAPAWLREGDAVRGDVALEIDPDLYRSGCYDYLDLPALIYPWRLDRIELEHAARVAAPEEVRARWGNPDLATNDPAARTLRQIEVANHEKDRRPGEIMRYHLHCTLQSRIPRMPDAADLPPAVPDA
ncbi:hypothetical protein SAMN05216486_10410 [bacterium JGI 053]|nr:hypothetical protein SAMN05216486_10410 [bacterium JGI 053]